MAMVKKKRKKYKEREKKIEIKKGEEKNENFGKFKPCKVFLGLNVGDAFFLSYNT
jgi:hypothetical protein